jgi:hypothetical protein
VDRRTLYYPLDPQRRYTSDDWELLRQMERAASLGNLFAHLDTRGAFSTDPRTETQAFLKPLPSLTSP